MHTETESFAERNWGHLLVRALLRGVLVPPRNSKEAPPPVEMLEIVLGGPDWWTAATGIASAYYSGCGVRGGCATALAIFQGAVWASRAFAKTPMYVPDIVLALAISAE